VPEIEGVDTTGGLRRVAGNKKLFRSLLEQFAAKQKDAAAQIRAALGSGDRELAGRTAHTVKGVAGNLGMGSVQQAAEKVERAVKDSDPSIEALIGKLEEALGRMVAAIEKALPPAVPAPATVRQAADRPAVLAALARLKQLAEASDGAAVDEFAGAEGVLAGAVDPAALAEVHNALGDFEFEKAVAKLDQIARTFEAGGN
jgi:HPt (histidine-containing phosphotransfer) domain-containing protein